MYGYTGRVSVYDSLVFSVPDWIEVPESCPLIGQYSATYKVIKISALLVSLPTRNILI